MGDFSLSGGVEVFGFISPSSINDTYPVIDPLYGIDGFRNVNLISELNAIPVLRRRAGMVVGVSGGTTYYKLNSSPWNYTISDWSIFSSGGGSSGGTVSGDYLPLSGGTVTGVTYFQGTSPNPEYVTFFKGSGDGAKLGIGVSGDNTFGVSNDSLTSGGTGYAKYTVNASEIVNNIIDGNGTIIMNDAFKLSTTGDATIGGFLNFTTEPNIENANDHFLTRNQSTGAIEVRELQTLPTVDGFTFNQSTYDLTIELNNGTDYTQNLSILASDVNITGGTYNPQNGVVTFTNNTGGTFSVSGFSTNYTDIYTTGSTFNPITKVATFNRTDNNTYTLNLSALTTTDVFVTGGTYSAGTLSFTNITGGTFTVTGLYSGVTSIGRTLFVSNTGNDNTAVVGDITKPWANIYAAKSASTSGDTIYVLPGTWSFDNTNAAGNPYNSQMNTIVNLWKNGITYYFSPNTKILFFNQTITGSPMYLFNPLNTSGETCTILGYLEWEGRSIGANTFNGHSVFLWLDSNNDSGFTFHAEVKKLTSYANEIVRVNRNVTFTSDTQVADIRIVADEIYKQYVGGQSGAASTEFISSTDSVLIYNSHVKRRIKNDSASGHNFFQITGNYTRSMVNFYGDYFLNVTANAPSVTIRSFTGIVNIDINEMYWNGTFVQSLIAGGGTLNIKGNLIDYVKNNNNTGGVVFMSIANNTVNINGNITTNTGSGVGRYIAATSAASTISVNGNITYFGTGTTTQTMFQAQNNGFINYTGNITGTYGGPVARTYNGTVNLNNCFIRSTTDSATSQLFINGISTLGYFRLNNSYVELKNNTNALSDGRFLNSFINNSTIINSGSGNTLSNTGTTGNLQITNSTLISSFSGATSILNTGTTPVMSTNTTVNTPYNIVDLRGSINIFTDLIY